MWNGVNHGCLVTLGGLLLFGLHVPAQATSYNAAVTATADPLATEAAGFLLSIPGVGDDFVLFADGQLEFRPNGTARLSAYLHRSIAFGAAFFVQLEFSGKLEPNDPGYPPAGSPIVTLQPGAYVPNGPIDPATFSYYTQVTGTFTGLRSYQGALITATNLGVTQLGLGANNKNLGNGIAVDLDLQVLQPSTSLPFVPTGPAELRADLMPSLPHCATHVDADPLISSGPNRLAALIPGLASDYVFLPVGTWLEADDGTASLHGLLRRESDYDDQWQCDLQLSGRIDPGQATFPPAGSPVLGLDPSTYLAQGGPIDPDQWRYYATTTGSLIGAGINEGGLIDLTGNGALQVGLGAGQGNLFFGATATLAPVVTTQPTARTITLLGDITLQCNLGTECILPTPQVLTGEGQTIDSLPDLPAIYTGIDLGWCEQVAVDNMIIASTDPRHWYYGNLQVRDHQTVEVVMPQGLAVGPHPVRLLDRSGGTEQLTLQVQAPTSPTLRTESTMLTGEAQHWIMHQGNLQGPVLSYLVLSGSNTPSILPGQISLLLGNQFQQLITVFCGLHDPATGLLVIEIPSMPPVFVGQRIYSQIAMIEIASANILPLPTTNLCITDY
jgi:hypothetical protein